MNKKLKLIKFLVIFFVIIGVYYSFILLFSEYFDVYINHTASISAWFLNLFYGTISVNGAFITGPEHNVVLSFGCEGSEPLVIFLAAVLAFPAAIKYKLKGLLIGLPTIYILNIIRIALLYKLGEVLPQHFDIFHNGIMPILFILIAIVFFFIWVKNDKK